MKKLAQHLNPGNPTTLKLDQYTIHGFSVGGLSTYVAIPELNMVFDMGDCPLNCVPINNVFITHGHGDHTRCVLRHYSLRGLLNIPAARYFIPKEYLNGFNKLAEGWSELEGLHGKKQAPPEFVALSKDQSVRINQSIYVKTFNVTHNVPSLGYTVYEVRKKLKTEYKNLSGLELAQLRKDGIIIEDEISNPAICFIGDSTRETFYDEQHIRKARILIIEATFLGDNEIETAYQKGHTHLQDIIDFHKQYHFENSYIVLKHFSMRYDPHRIRSIINAKLPKDLLERTYLLL